MVNHNYLRNLLKFSALLLLISMISCIPQKKLRYLQEVEESSVDTTQTDEISTVYIIKAKDEIYLKINSVDPSTYSFFNGGDSRSSANMYNSELGLYLNSYTVSDSGYIQLPVAGKIKIVGMDLEKARFEVESVLKLYLNDVSVTLKLSGFRITLIGEVRRPGRYAPLVSQLNILEALAVGGDMTSYGNRQRVMVIREIDGKEHIHFIDLLDNNLIYSQNFNLLPNDIIYVESLNAKTWGFEKFPYVLILSSITTFIALMALINTMK